MPKSKSFEIRKYSEIILFCILLISVLLPREYKSVFSGSLGKVIILGSVVGIAYTSNMLSTLLSSLIAIVLMDNVVEGHEVLYENNEEENNEEEKEDNDENINKESDDVDEKNDNENNDMNELD